MLLEDASSAADLFGFAVCDGHELQPLDPLPPGVSHFPEPAGSALYAFVLSFVMLSECHASLWLAGPAASHRMALVPGGVEGY